MAPQLDRIFAAWPASDALHQVPVAPLPHEGGPELKWQVPPVPVRNGVICLMAGAYADHERLPFAMGLLAGDSIGAADLTGFDASAPDLH